MSFKKDPGILLNDLLLRMRCERIRLLQRKKAASTGQRAKTARVSPRQAAARADEAAGAAKEAAP